LISGFDHRIVNGPQEQGIILSSSLTQQPTLSEVLHGCHRMAPERLRRPEEAFPRKGDFIKRLIEQLVFATSQPLTVGVECELALLDAKTLRPAYMGLALIEELASPQIEKESFDHMVEVTSTVSATVHETATQLKQEMENLAVACEQHGLLITGAGRPPTIRLADIRQVPDERYERLNNERKILNERFGTLGMHVHLGMPDAEQCVRYHKFFFHAFCAAFDCAKRKLAL
jgi:hypothetical protein